ncbi:MAG: ABC transporter ATP-binding protein [Bacteroidota bacterium]
MIEVKNLTKNYNGKPAVAHVSFTVSEGEKLILLGTSGSGKTTTLKMLNRLIEPDTGKIFINRQNIYTKPVEELRRKIGYVIQHTGLFPHYTVAENIKLVPELLGWKPKAMIEKVAELMEMLKLPAEMQSSYPDELSGGQKQRVGLARALAADPPLILLDEPFGALDPVTREHLQDEFLALEYLASKTMVMVTHDVAEAVKLGDKICLMSEGRIIQMGKAHELLFEPANDFVVSFFNPQRFLLELSIIQLDDLQDVFTDKAKSTEALPTIHADTPMIEVLKQFAANDTSKFAVSDGEDKVIYDASRAEILEAYYQKYK